MHPLPPDVPTDVVDGTQQSAAARNPMSMLTGAIPKTSIDYLLVPGTATGRDSRSATRPRPIGLGELYAYPVKRDMRDPYFHLPTVSTRPNRFSTLY